MHCSDYITEKFWINSLRSGVVPIVWGPSKSDVIEVAPENSFIHFEDFDTVEDLVDYISYLDNNDEEYRKFFKWRENGTTKIQSFEKEEKYDKFSTDQVCEDLYKIRTKKQTIKSIYENFTGGEPPECLQVTAFRKLVGFIRKFLGNYF